MVLTAIAGLFAALAVLALVWRGTHRRVGGGGRPSPTESPSLAARLSATRDRISAALESAVGSGLPATRFDRLEEALIGADVGVRTAKGVVANLRQRSGAPGDLRSQLRDVLVELLRPAAPPAAISSRPWVILVTGVNGVGKTTTIGKLAALHVAAKRRVLVVAADTFRAAAAEQLAVWAERAGADIVRHQAGGTPAAVVFDGLRAAVARGVDVVLIDSAGRLHTRDNLMEELRKLTRVMQREVTGAPHEVLIVLDASTGQNAVAQARQFLEFVGVTGVVLTKLDGTARGGVALSVRRELGLPIRYIGVGEGIGDLQEFDATTFVAALTSDRRQV